MQNFKEFNYARKTRFLLILIYTFIQINNKFMVHCQLLSSDIQNTEFLNKINRKFNLLKNNIINIYKKYNF